MRQLSIALLVFALPSLARADVEIYLRDGSKVKGVIVEESTQGIKLQGSKDLIVRNDIVDVLHELNPLGARLGSYRPAERAEKDYLDPAKEAVRLKNLADAISKYRETLKKMDPGQAFAERHVQFKVAYLTAQQVHEGAGKAEFAMLDLRDFKTKHPNSWQLVECLKNLAEMQMSIKDFTSAEGTYKELANANVDPATKHEAELLAAQVSMRAGNYPAAQKRLQEVVAKLPKDSPVLGRAQIAVADAMLASKQVDPARKMLEGIIKGTQDTNVKSRAYNTLGKSYFDAGMLKEARWEFLWVDVMYNDNRDEHAKALYHLWQIFSTLGEQERGLQCRDLLLNNRLYLGTEYQRIAKEKAG